MSKLTKKVLTIGIAVVTAVSLSGVSSISAQTSTADLQTQIAALLAQIQALQAQLAGTPPASTYNFTKNLTLGSKGADVKALQQFLNANGYAVAASGVGSAGNETTYFGPATKAALAKFQAAKGITPAVGYFGIKTRAAVAAVTPTTPTGPTGPVVVVPAGTDLLVELASDTPSAKTIGSGTAFNPSLKVKLSAGTKDVKITSLTLKKGGFVANTNLNGVDVVDSKGVRHGQVVTSINADNTIIIGMSSTPITVKAGTSETILVRFNLVSGNITGTVGFSIESVSAISADTTAISGSFPISGQAMNIVSGASSLATMTLDVMTSSGSSTLNVSETSLQEITKFRIQETSSNEGSYLHSLMLYNYGNAGDADYKDVTLEAQDGTVLATAQPSGQYVTFSLVTPYFIDKGMTRDFTVKAKLIGGTTKTVNLVVYNNYDIDLRGASTNVSVIPAAGSNDTSFPIGNGFNIQTIGSGSMTLTRASDSPSSAVSPGSTSVVLAKFKAKPTGENFELRQVSFYIATSSSGIVLTGTVYVKVGGAIVYSTAASNIGVASASTFTLSSYPILTAGVDNIITIEGSINSSATSASNYTVTSFDLIQAKRLVTNDLVDPGVGTVSGLQISVNAAALSVVTLQTPVINSVVAGTTEYEYATFQLLAQTSGEDVKVSKIVVTHSGGTVGEVGNLLMYKGSDTSPLATSASTATNAATVNFSFSTPILVTKATPVTLRLKADAISGTGAHTFSIASSTSAVTAVGATTGNSLASGSDITFSGSGQAQTHVAAGQLNVALLSGSGATPSVNQTVSVDTAGGTYFAFELRSKYETQKITSLKITASSTSGGTLSATTLQNVKLYEGTSVTPIYPSTAWTCASGVCSATFGGSSTDNLLSAPVPTTGVKIYAKADVSAGGISDLGDTFAFKIASTTGDIAIKGSVTGSTSGTKSGSAGATDQMYFTYVVPQNVMIAAIKPITAQQLGSSGNGAVAGQQLAVFTVKNNGSSAIRLATSTVFRFAQSGTTTSTFKVYIGDSEAGAITALNSTATSTVSSYVSFDISGASAANRTINAGATKYLVIKNEQVMTSGSTAQFSADAIGDLLFQVSESALGYSGNPSSDNDTDDVIQALPISGIPASVASNTAL